MPELISEFIATGLQSRFVRGGLVSEWLSLGLVSRFVPVGDVEAAELPGSINPPSFNSDPVYNPPIAITPAPPSPGGQGPQPGTGEASVFSNTTQVTQRVYMNGRDQINGEVWAYVEPDKSQLSGGIFRLCDQRLMGTIDVSIKVNGITISGGTGQFNNTNDRTLKILGLDYTLTAGDVVSIDMTGNSFSPSNTQIDMFLIFN